MSRMEEVMAVDLAEWLTRIWDEEEESAQFSIELTERAYPSDEFNVRWKWARLTEHKTSGGYGNSFEPGAPSPQQVLARIAADRKILALHTGDHECPGEVGWWGPSTTAGAWCPTARLLASPYADRTGYREEWLAVERQESGTSSDQVGTSEDA